MAGNVFTEEWLAQQRQKVRPSARIVPQATIATPATTQPQKEQKFHQKGVLYDSHWFASGKECARYKELRLLERVGAIRDLECQPRYELYASNGELIGKFTPDFRYWNLEIGRLVVEDVKGGKATRTEAYMLRKRLFTACHGIQLSEV